MPALNRRWLLAKRPSGESVGEANFRRVDTPIPSPKPGQMLVRNLWLSLDPSQVFFMTDRPKDGGIPLGGVMQALAVGEVVESRLPGYRPGDVVHGLLGWEDFTLTDGVATTNVQLAKVPRGTPPSLALGALGFTGMAAYFGIVDVGKPASGETFVVSAAAGGVGSVAGQIARILGLHVIGVAGGRRKCDWLVDEAGFDGAIDYLVEDVGSRLSALCPDGIDIFFDNVGGPVLDEALARLRMHGRVVLCGTTSRYLKIPRPPGPARYGALINVRGRMEGFFASDYADRFPEARKALAGWIRSGQLKPKEDVMNGLENAPKALARLFTGANLGKQMLKIADSSTGP